MYVHTNKDAFQRVQFVNEGMHTTIPIAKRSFQALETVRTILEKRVADPEMSSDKSAKVHLVNIRFSEPKLFEQIKGKLPPTGRILYRYHEGGYKVVIQSPVCTTVSFIKREMIDTRRRVLPFGCSFYGFWNAKGADF